MKKLVIGSVAVVAVALLIGTAVAGPGWGGRGSWGGHMMRGGPGAGYGPQMMGPAYEYGRGQYGPTEEQIKARDKFFTETEQLRKDLTAKHAEQAALMHGDNPDPAKVAQLSREIFDLRTQLQKKADEAGFSAGYGRGYQRGGRGFGPGYGPGSGPGYGTYRPRGY